MLPPGPIVSLAYRVPRERREALLDFLRDAIPFYERPGAIRVGLYESLDEPGLFLELVAYANERAYALDQARVEADLEMLATLSRFRDVVGKGVEVRRMQPVAITPASVGPAIERAGFNDHDAIAKLLSEADLPIPDAEDAPVIMLVARRDARVVGCAGWERHGEHALLRSVVVDAGERGRDVGRALVSAALAEIAAAGMREVYLLTMHVAPFFATHGFSPIDRAALPESIRASRQFTMQRCASATCMRRELGA